MADAASAPVGAWVGDRILRVTLGDRVSPESHDRVRAAFEALRAAGLPGLRDVTPAYTTLLLTFDATTLDTAPIERRVGEILSGLATRERGAARLVEIPVCYEGECAPDLDDVARLHDVDPAHIVELHASVEYVVAFLGFSPGFPYLLGLPARLATPRLDRPRPRVPAGSVGIAGRQTGIYPSATPGGWRLVGRTPRRLFDAARPDPALLRVGDRVRLVPITLAEFSRAGEGA